jgi:hypothetical protein
MCRLDLFWILYHYEPCSPVLYYGIFYRHNASSFYLIIHYGSILSYELNGVNNLPCVLYIHAWINTLVNVTNVNLTHNYPMNQPMCLDFYKHDRK